MERVVFDPTRTMQDVIFLALGLGCFLSLAALLAALDERVLDRRR
jgi:hypothetical protein